MKNRILSRGYEDHPRIRGEHALSRSMRNGLPGSSPHTRGAPVTGSLAMTRSGIIPAYAGSTSRSSAICFCCTDHPRIRGEHLRRFPTTPSPVGSSPHTRGAPSSRSPRRCRLRIIPAYAGSTAGWWPRGVFSGDHPRIRGEHWSRRDVFDRAKGSSPHTRGAPT